MAYVHTGTGLVGLFAVLVTSASFTQSPPRTAPQALDYVFFKDQVQPIFLKKRPGYARWSLRDRRAVFVFLNVFVFVWR